MNGRVFIMERLSALSFALFTRAKCSKVFGRFGNNVGEELDLHSSSGAASDRKIEKNEVGFFLWLLNLLGFRLLLGLLFHLSSLFGSVRL